MACNAPLAGSEAVADGGTAIATAASAQTAAPDNIPTATEQQTGPDDAINGESGIQVPLEDFRTALVESLVNQDYATLRSMMGEPFRIGRWQSEGYTRNSNEAMIELQLLLPEDASIRYELGRDVTVMLQGTPPERFWGDGAAIVDVVFSTGWGTDGNGEALLFIAEAGNGGYFWHSLVYAPQAFSSGTDTAEGGTLLSFQDELMQAIIARDYDRTATYMGASFELIEWQGPAQALASSAAIAALRERLLPADGTIRYQYLTDLSAIVGNTDPLTIWQPGVPIVSVIYSQGWGANRADETLLAVGRAPDGSLFWHGMLVAYGGF